MLDLVADQPRDFVPGTQFAYSNTNYIVAGLLLEAVTGEALSENLRVRIVEPLKPDIDLLGLRRNTLTGRRVLELPARWRHQRRLLPRSRDRLRCRRSLVSTASDLAIFIRVLAHGELLDAATYAEMGLN